MRATPALPVVLTALCAAVSTSIAAAQTLADPPIGELRDCGSRGEGTAPQKLPLGGVRIGPLVLWPSIRARPGGPPNGSEWPFVIKVPVVLEARRKVVLAIAPEAVGRAAFQHRRRYVTAVRFEACRESVLAWAYKGTVGKLTGFPFAIGLAQRSACIPMELWIDGRQTPIRRVIPAGRRTC